MGYISIVIKDDTTRQQRAPAPVEKGITYDNLREQHREQYRAQTSSAPSGPPLQYSEPSQPPRRQPAKPSPRKYYEWKLIICRRCSIFSAI